MSVFCLRSWVVGSIITLEFILCLIGCHSITKLVHWDLYYSREFILLRLFHFLIIGAQTKLFFTFSFLQERERDHFSQFITEGFTSYCKRKRRDKVLFIFLFCTSQRDLTYIYFFYQKRYIYQERYNRWGDKICSTNIKNPYKPMF